MEVYKLRHVNDALLEAPVLELCKERARNWLAVVDINPVKPGGFDRYFLPQGRGGCLYITEQLMLFDAVEFGGDRIAWSGNIVQNRWYGVFVKREGDFLFFESAANGNEAVLRSRALKAGVGVGEVSSADLVRLSNARKEQKLAPPVESLEQVQAQADALQAACLLLTPPKRKTGKTFMYAYYRQMAEGNYRQAFVALKSAAQTRAQKQTFYKALEAAHAQLWDK